MAWDMPASLVVPGRATYAGQETDRRDWYQGTVTPLCKWYAMHFTQALTEEFGDEYRDYMQRVPGWNVAAGLWRRARRRN